MEFKEYHDLIAGIAESPAEKQTAPYDNPLYLDFTSKNFSIMNNWFENGEISEALIQTIKNISSPQEWLIITEPWSADAAQNIPFIQMAANLNPLIKVNYELRDSEPFSIEKYLTNGTKSIPKLIIRNENGKDLATWGSRPAGCQELFLSLQKEEAPFDKLVDGLVNWYTQNKGEQLQSELNTLLS